MSVYGFIADDFTGAVDALWHYQRFGLRTELVVDPRGLADVPPSTDVIGIATTLRTQPADRIDAELSTLVPALLERGVRFLQYKVCSTFDSSPLHGSIGAAIDHARAHGGFRGVIPVMPAQPELGRFTRFATHFARASDGEVHRIDRHPVMSVHPVTPATEADLRDHLRQQTTSAIGAVYTDLLDDDALVASLRAGEARSESVVLDASSETDAIRIGAALHALVDGDARPLFAVGSGGLSWALAHHARRHDAQHASTLPPAGGPVLALSGSRSSVTSEQIAHAERHGWASFDLLAGAADATRGAAEALRAGRNAIILTSRGAQAGEVEAPDIGDRLAAAALECLEITRIARLVVMGGDTSGEVLGGLGVRSLRIRASMPPMLPLCEVRSSHPLVDGLDVALKGGQLGSPDYLERIAT